jgi:hypothetical protein
MYTRNVVAVWWSEKDENELRFDDLFIWIYDIKWVWIFVNIKYIYILFNSII